MNSSNKRIWIYNGKRLTEDEVFTLKFPKKGFSYFDFFNLPYRKSIEEMNLHSILFHLAGTVPSCFSNREELLKFQNDINYMLRNSREYQSNFYKQDVGAFIDTLQSIVAYKIVENKRIKENPDIYSYTNQHQAGTLSDDVKQIYTKGKEYQMSKLKAAKNNSTESASE